MGKITVFQSKGGIFIKDCILLVLNVQLPPYQCESQKQEIQLMNTQCTHKTSDTCRFLRCSVWVSIIIGSEPCELLFGIKFITVQVPLNPLASKRSEIWDLTRHSLVQCQSNGGDWNAYFPARQNLPAT